MGLVGKRHPRCKAAWATCLGLGRWVSSSRQRKGGRRRGDGARLLGRAAGLDPGKRLRTSRNFPPLAHDGHEAGRLVRRPCPREPGPAAPGTLVSNREARRDPPLADQSRLQPGWASSGCWAEGRHMDLLLETGRGSETRTPVTRGAQPRPRLHQETSSRRGRDTQRFLCLKTLMSNFKLGLGTKAGRRGRWG